MLHAVIMAGGSGTRFWPASRQIKPKQLLKMGGVRTMLQTTFDRLQGLVSSEHVLVATNQQLTEAVAAQLPNLPLEHIIGEPFKRDTAPCIGVAGCVPSATLARIGSMRCPSSSARRRRACSRTPRLFTRRGCGHGARCRPSRRSIRRRWCVTKWTPRTLAACC